MSSKCRKKSSEASIELTVEKLIHRGVGLCRETNGRVLLIRHVLPGESVFVHSIVKQKGTYWVDSFDILKPSPDRTTERCPQSSVCGGCPMIFMSQQRERQEKLNIFNDILERARIACQQPPQVTHCHFSSSRYRGTLHFKNGKTGFYRQGSHQIAPLTGCKVLPPVLIHLLKPLDQVLHQFPQQSGDLLFAITPDHDALLLHFKLHSKASSAFKKNLLDALANRKEVRGVSVEYRRKKQLLCGSDWLEFHWNRSKVQLKVSSFFQSNPKSWPMFWKLVTSWSESCVQQGEWIWDGHAGSGFLASALSNHLILATEPSPQTMKNLRGVVGQEGLCFQCTAESKINHERTLQLGGMILDPPRSGLSNKLKQWIVEKGPASVLLFSCEWSTLARDLSALLKSYRIIEPLHIIDVNPGTFRAEAAVFLTRLQEIDMSS
ncbi:MAG: hypothetical protein CR997_10870 [Acidobacteria bacterium]|nr:MAG: hypothetical protein CR997_10870 [Acidobacteriota bacterium]